MSSLGINEIHAHSGGVIRIKDVLVFDKPVPGMNLGPINYIGIPGTQGFGVGICPNQYPGFSPMDGTNNPASANYGNYQYSDGSIMVWIPAFWLKVGTGANGVATNRFDIKAFNFFDSVGSANANGYHLPRAFYEGGQIKAGFFVDKFHCANNNGIASSIRLLSPLSTSSARNGIGALTGAPANNYGGTLAAAKTRGNIFHASTLFQHAILGFLSKAHADASTSTTFNAWYNASANFPKGNNNNAAYNDVNDPLVTFTRTSDADFNLGYYSSLNGSGSMLAKTTHNGQECGVADVNGNVWDVCPGLTSDGTNYYIAPETVSQNGMTSANAFGAPAGWSNVGATLGFAGNFLASPSQRIGNAANQVFEANTSGTAWLQTSAGIARSAGVSAGGTAEFGQDYAYDGRPNQLAPLCGGYWADGSFAGVFALYLLAVAGNSYFSVGFRACSFGSL